jgi:hypothetical protein
MVFLANDGIREGVDEMAADRQVKSGYWQLLRATDRHAAWAGLVALVVIIGFSRGVYVAAIFALAAVVGYLNAFVLFRSVVAALFIRTPARPKGSIAAFCILGSAGLVWLDHWQPLVIITMSFIVIDALVLRFRR